MNVAKAVGIGLLSFVGLVLLFGIPTALIPTQWFGRMTPARTLDYLFLLANSALLGAYIGLYYYEKSAITKRTDTLATSGSIFNILAVGCPICNKVLVALLGFSAVLTYVEPARVWFGLASTALVSVALVTKAKTVCKTCTIDKTF